MKCLPISKKTDRFYDRFKLEFEEIIFDLILDFYPGFTQKNVLDEIVTLYATEIFSASESVIDKDKNYPEYRKIEELEYMNKVLYKEKGMAGRNEFSGLHSRQS